METICEMVVVMGAIMRDQMCVVSMVMCPRTKKGRSCGKGEGARDKGGGGCRDKQMSTCCDKEALDIMDQTRI